MSIVGYNVDTESSDPVVGVELDSNGRAILFFDESQGCTDIPLSYDEVCALLVQLRDVYLEMRWKRATYLFASTMISKKTHLLHKGTIKRPTHDLTHEMEEHALCGQSPPSYGWSLDPVTNEPDVDCCKRCQSRYAKEQKSRRTS